MSQSKVFIQNSILDLILAFSIGEDRKIRHADLKSIYTFCYQSHIDIEDYELNNLAEELLDRIYYDHKLEETRWLSTLESARYEELVFLKNYLLFYFETKNIFDTNIQLLFFCLENFLDRKVLFLEENYIGEINKIIGIYQESIFICENMKIFEEKSLLPEIIKFHALLKLYFSFALLNEVRDDALREILTICLDAENIGGSSKLVNTVDEWLCTSEHAPYFIINEFKNRLSQKEKVEWLRGILNILRSKNIHFNKHLLKQLIQNMNLSQMEFCMSVFPFAAWLDWKSLNYCEYLLVPNKKYVIEPSGLKESEVENLDLWFDVDQDNKLRQISQKAFESKDVTGKILRRFESFYCYDLETSKMQSVKAAHASLNIMGLKCKRGGRVLLEDIYLSAHSGEVIGICGPSGCGKTSLLMALAGLTEAEINKGYYKNERLRSLSTISQDTTYIAQDDILFEELSVRESIEFSSALHVKGSKKYTQKNNDELINLLGLKDIENVRVGDVYQRGLSGGQRRRVNIGSILIGRMNSILLFDEPTTGLDMEMAQEMIEILHALSRRGYIVFIVTHHINTKSLPYFDKLLVLNGSGEQLYFHTSNYLLDYFSIRHFQDLYQRLNEEDYRKKFVESTQRQHIQDEQTLLDSYEISDRKWARSEITKRKKKTSIYQQFKTLLVRDVCRRLRDWQFLATCALQPFLIALLIIADFDGPEPFALFAMVVSALWVGSVAGARSVNSEWSQLDKDWRLGVGLFPYLCSKQLSGFLFTFPQTCLIFISVTWIESFYGTPFNLSFSSSLFILSLLNFFGVSLGIFLSCIFRSSFTSLMALPICLIPLLVKSGFMYRHSDSEGLNWYLVKYNPVRMSMEYYISSFDGILASKTNYHQKRKAEDYQFQIKRWNKYLSEKEQFEKDPERYQKEMSNMRRTDQELSSIFNLKPNHLMKPIGIEESELLVHQPRLWLSGYEFLEVETENQKMFNNIKNAKARLGLARVKNNQYLGIYSRYEIPILMAIEILVLFLLSMRILKLNLKPMKKI